MSVPLALHVVGISGSPSQGSRSRTLLEAALAAAAELGARTTLIDLAALPAEGLLARRRAPEVEFAVEAVRDARVVVASTPVYRATYTGLLKLFFDLLPPHALADKVALGIATAGNAGHAAVIDHGLRPLFASLDAVVSPAGLFATDAEFIAGLPQEPLLARVRAAADACVHLAGALHASARQASALAASAARARAAASPPP